MIRKVALVVCFSVLVFSAGRALLAGERYDLGRTFAPNITANTRSGQSYPMSFGEVERKLNLLARTASMEDMWLYVVEDGTLYDVGIKNTVDSVNIDYEFLKSGKIEFSGKHVIHIHIHPWKAENSRAFRPSSHPDLHFYAGHTDPYFKEKGVSQIRYLVFDGHGVWEMVSMSSEFKELMVKPESQSGKQSHRVCRFVDEVKLSSDSVSERNRAAENYIAKCKTVGLTMTYKSLE